MTNLAYAAPRRFYRHSGKVPLPAWIATTLSALLSGAILGAAYGILSFFGHLIPFTKLFLIIEAAAPFALGVALGALPARVLRRLKGRSTLTALMMALLAVTVGLYATWLAYLSTLFLYAGHPIPLKLLLVPSHFAATITALANVGVWRIDKDLHPQGAFLWIVWGLEAAVILGTALLTAFNVITAAVFCEQCKTWGALQTLARLESSDEAQICRDLAVGNVQSLAAARLASDSATTWLSVTLEGCAACEGVQALNLTRITLVPNKQGNAGIKRRKLVNRIMLTPEATGELLLAVATLNAPPPEPNPEPAPDSPTPPAP